MKDISFWITIWVTFAFFLFVILIGRPFWKKIASLLDNKTENIQKKINLNSDILKQTKQDKKEELLLTKKTQKQIVQLKRHIRKDLIIQTKEFKEKKDKILKFYQDMTDNYEKQLDQDYQKYLKKNLMVESTNYIKDYLQDPKNISVQLLILEDSLKQLSSIDKSNISKKNNS